MDRNSDYSDIIGHPRWEPRNHKRMSMHNRAAQFSPFQALSGYEDEISETGRLTESQIILDEYEAGTIDGKLRRLAPGDRASITYFKPDDKKGGGSYPTISGTVRKIDLAEHTVEIMLEQGYNRDMPRAQQPKAVIPIASIVDVEIGKLPNRS